MALRSDDLAARLEPIFAENFSKFGELGAAVSIWQNGAPVLELHDGYRDAQRKVPWGDETLVLIWSATKGLAALACYMFSRTTKSTSSVESRNSGRRLRRKAKRTSPSPSCFTSSRSGRPR